MERNVMWTPWHNQGVEHLHLLQEEKKITATGAIITVVNNVPLYLAYTIFCSTTWNVQVVQLYLLDSSKWAMCLEQESPGHWTMPFHVPLPQLQHCTDIDISLTPFTNTIPVRRLSLQPGQSADITVAYIDVPALLKVSSDQQLSTQIKAIKQRYTCLSLYDNGGIYEYENLSSGYTAELPVDSDGLVLDYPNAFRRVWTDSVSAL